jgi:hypothetical protein
MTLDIDREKSAVGYTLPSVVTIVGGAGFVTLGVWGWSIRSRSADGPTKVATPALPVVASQYEGQC